MSHQPRYPIIAWTGLILLYVWAILAFIGLGMGVASAFGYGSDSNLIRLSLITFGFAIVGLPIFHYGYAPEKKGEEE